MAFGSFGSGLAEGLPEGVSLYNALKMQPFQRQRAQQEAQMGAQQLADYQDRVPTTIGGQTFQLPMMDAAKFQEQIAERQMQTKMMMQMMMAREQLGSKMLNTAFDANDHVKVAALPTAIALHNFNNDLYNFYQQAETDPGNTRSLWQKFQTGAMQKGYKDEPIVSALLTSDVNSPQDVVAINRNVKTLLGQEITKLQLGGNINEKAISDNVNGQVDLNDSPEQARMKSSLNAESAILATPMGIMSKISAESPDAAHGQFPSPYHASVYKNMQGYLDPQSPNYLEGKLTPIGGFNNKLDVSQGMPGGTGYGSSGVPPMQGALPPGIGGGMSSLPGGGLPAPSNGAALPGLVPQGAKPKPYKILSVDNGPL